MTNPYASDTIWYDKFKSDEAECKYFEHLAQQKSSPKVASSTEPPAKSTPTSSLVDEIARTREHIKHSLQSRNLNTAAVSGNDAQLTKRVSTLEEENHQLKNNMTDMKSRLALLEARMAVLEKRCNPDAAKPVVANHVAPVSKPAIEKKETKNEANDDDDDIDLFGSDEDEEANQIREKRLQEYAAKKSKKPQVIAKSSVILDVKPWDDETDMSVMETEVRKVTMDGLLWGASKLVPLAFGIKKLQICCVVEDEKVSIEELQEKLEEIEDLVQSVDIAAFNKI